MVLTRIGDLITSLLSALHCGQKPEGGRAGEGGGDCCMAGAGREVGGGGVDIDAPYRKLIMKGVGLSPLLCPHITVMVH